MDDDHISSLKLNEVFERFIARLRRAVEHRESLEGYCQQESAVTVDLAADRNSVIVSIKQSEPVPDIASTILSDWLHQVRSALDGAFYTLAAVETGTNPPTRPRTRSFPIRASRADFDEMIASDSNPTRGMTPSTVDKIERSQPYNGKYGADGDGLLWIHNMARIDRHRHSFDLTFRVVPDERNGIDFAPLSPRPLSVTPGPADTTLSVTSGTIFATIEYESHEVALRAVKESWIRPRFMFGLEAAQWYEDAVARDASNNIRNDSLTARMRFCEWFVAALVKMLSDQVTIEELHIPDWINVGD